MSHSKQPETSLSRFVKILSELQHDLVTLAVPRKSVSPLTLTQYLLLGVLRDVKKPVTLATAASLMESTIPLVKILIVRLVAMGCVNRSSTGLYYITRAGLKEYDVIYRHQTARVDAILKKLTDEERAMGVAIYEKIQEQRRKEKSVV